MTEKTEYIAASIDLLEQEDELNSTELAVLCNLKKYMNKADHQPTFEVGEYYASKTGIVFKITSKTTKEELAAVKSLVDGEIIDGMIDTTEIMFRYSKPATAEEIFIFKRAEHFAKHGRKLDEFHVGDKVENEECQIGIVQEPNEKGQVCVQLVGESVVTGYYSAMLDMITLIQTAEELREVE